MGKRLPFIGRSEELTLIDNLALATTSLHLLLIDGAGGIGKTSLLQEVERRCSGRTHIRTTGLLDFVDPLLRTERGFEDVLADRLGHAPFDSYFNAVQRYVKLAQQDDLTGRDLHEAEQKVRESWVTCFNTVTAFDRVVILCDTVEIVQHREMFDDVLATIAQLRNVLVVLAGREGTSLYDTLVEKGWADRVTLQPLQVFSTNEAANYLDTSLIGQELDAQTRAKIALLSGGLPILIDLALDWVERSIPLPDLLQLPLGILESLQNPAHLRSSKRAEEVQQAFELAPTSLDQMQAWAAQHWEQEILINFSSGLVRQVLRLQEPINHIILHMAHVYGSVDTTFLESLVDMPDIRSGRYIETLEDLAFIKSLPGKQYALHDRMRDLVNVYAWPLVDISGEERRQIDKRAAAYYHERSKRLAKEISALNAELERATIDEARALEASIRLLEGEQQYVVVQIDRLVHTLRIAPSEGLELAGKLYDQRDKPTRPYQQLLGDLVVQTLDDPQVRAPFRETHLIAADLLRLRDALNHGRLDQANMIAKRIENYPNIPDEERLDLLTRLARYAELIGQPQQAIDQLMAAQAICHRNQQLGARWEGAILNSLGRMYRIMGNYQEAEKQYEAGVQRIADTGDEARRATAYNNLGFALGLKSEYDRALVYCEEAFKIQEELGLRQDAARTQTTLGIIYRSFEQYARSLAVIEQAMRVFQDFQNMEWLARAYCERGTTYWHQGDLVKARSDVDTARAIEEERQPDTTERPNRNLVNILHVLGHIAWEQQQYTDALEYFSRCANIARTVSDVKQTINSLQGMVEIYYDLAVRALQAGEASSEEYYKHAEEQARWVEEYPEDRFSFPLYAGSRKRILGNIAYDRGNFPAALRLYKPAYEDIAARGGFSRYVLRDQLKLLRERMERLPPDVALDWCKELETFWKDQHLDQTYRGMIDICQLVRQGIKRRQTREHANSA
jgi:tetratricopeptide (TPR) repeat protein